MSALFAVGLERRLMMKALFRTLKETIHASGSVEDMHRAIHARCREVATSEDVQYRMYYIATTVRVCANVIMSSPSVATNHAKDATVHAGE